ncbi:hypothetical protein K438DRAFT_411766 [Mycena galopus ATCC 62051]|nr:hypothetical protein K438DRAFT_411766 [Mycena galopus ATCC 62051]
MHIFCFHCLRKWMEEGRKTCPVCHANISEAPIRDGAFETELDAAIGFGVVAKATGMRQAGSYNWAGIVFGV